MKKLLLLLTHNEWEENRLTINNVVSTFFEQSTYEVESKECRCLKRPFKVNRPPIKVLY